MGTPALGQRGSCQSGVRDTSGGVGRGTQGCKGGEEKGGAANQRRADCTLINDMSFKEREVTSTSAH